MVQHSPQVRSTRFLEQDGWLVEIVERNVTRQIKKDLFGFADLLAIQFCEKPLLIQVTSRSNIQSRRKKVLRAPAFSPALDSFNIEVHGWGRMKRHDNQWVCRVYRFEREGLFGVVENSEDRWAHKKLDAKPEADALGTGVVP